MYSRNQISRFPINEDNCCERHYGPLSFILKFVVVLTANRSWAAYESFSWRLYMYVRLKINFMADLIVTNRYKK